MDLKYETASLTRTVSGIQKGMSTPFGATAGGNGTYRIGYPEVIRALNLFFRRTDDIGWGVIDVRELVLNINDRSKITDNLMDTLKNQLIERMIWINNINKNKEWALKDNTVLGI